MAIAEAVFPASGGCMSNVGVHRSPQAPTYFRPECAAAQEHGPQHPSSLCDEYRPAPSA